MGTEADNIFERLNQISNSLKRVNIQAELLYREIWAEKVTNGYDKWRSSPEGKQFIISQLKKLDYKCAVCNCAIEENTVTIDHLRPKSKYLGFAMQSSNLLIMCRTCNAEKGSKNFEEWFENLPSQEKKNCKAAIEKIHGKKQFISLWMGD